MQNCFASPLAGTWFGDGRFRIVLLIEVAHSSLRYDRETKLPLYAIAGIPEV